MAGGRLRPGGGGLDEGAERADARVPRRAAALRRGEGADGGAGEVRVAALLRPGRARRHALRDEVGSSAAAALPGDAALRRGPRLGAHRPRSQPARREGGDRHRLVRTVDRRRQGRGVTVAGRDGDRRPPPLRGRERQGDRRRRPSREQRHRRRQRRVECGRHRPLVHALPPPRRAAAGGRGVLAAGLVPPPGHAGRRRRPRAGEGAAAHRRGGAPHEARRALGARGGEERGRRRPRLLGPPDVRRRLDAVRRLRRSRRRRLVRRGRRPVPPLPQGRVARQGAADAARDALARPGEGRRPRGQGRHRGGGAHALAALRARDRGRAVAPARVRPGRPRWQGPPHPAGVERRRRGLDAGRRRPLPEPELPRASRLVRLRSGGAAPGAHAALPDLARGLLRRGGGAHDGDVEGRHQGPDVHPAAQGHPARRQEPDHPERLRRLRHLRGAAVPGVAQALARAGWRPRLREHPRRRRLRGRLAPRRLPHEEAERVRRLRRLRAGARGEPDHLAGAARHPGRLERRPAHGRDDRAAPGRDAGGRQLRRHLRHAAGGDHAERRLQRHRVRHRQGSGPVPGAPRLLAVPARRARREVSGGDPPRRRARSARRRVAVEEVRGGAAGGEHLGPSRPPAHERHRPRDRQRARRGGGAAGRRDRVPAARARRRLPAADAAAARGGRRRLRDRGRHARTPARPAPPEAQGELCRGALVPVRGAAPRARGRAGGAHPRPGEGGSGRRGWPDPRRAEYEAP